MKKEILFRGKTPFTGTIGSDKWIESKSIRIQGNYVYLFIENKWVQTNTDTLGQYTGLKDKNGAKIFEGDITKDIEVIGYCDKCYSYQPHWHLDDKILCHNCDGNFNLLDIAGNIEIIGNIHDNPELLEK